MKLNEITQGQKIKEIESWCKDHNIETFHVNPDFSVDVPETVDLYGCGLTELPFKFGKVYGNFDVTNCKLKNFDNFPRLCYSLILVNNPITSLIGIQDQIKFIHDNGNTFWRNMVNVIGCPIKEGGIGLLLIENLKKIMWQPTSNRGEHAIPAFEIIAKYEGRPDDIYECQAELIHAGFEDFAKI